MICFFQNCGPLKSALDEGFLKNLATNNAETEDTRVAQGMSSLLQRQLLIITSKKDGVTSTLYRPFVSTSRRSNVAQPGVSTIALGHIEDHHYVPLKRRGMQAFITLHGNAPRQNL